MTTSNVNIKSGVIPSANHAGDAYVYTAVNNPNTWNQTQNAVLVSNSTIRDHNVVFHGPGGKEVGRLDFNGEEMKFDGQADISAQVFIDWARSTFNERVVADKREMLKEVMDALLHESTGALYEDTEKLAILACIQRVREIQQSVEPPMEKTHYGNSLAKSMMDTKNAVATSIMGAFRGQK